MTPPKPRACVIGWPISHSRSPLIHNYWLKVYGIDGVYEKIAVPPQDLAGFLDSIRHGEFVGCNITIPHKEAAFRLVEVDDAATRLLAAVNTIYLEDGRLVGTSTDGAGFLNHLTSCHPDWSSRGKTIAVIGAGGAARAIIAAAQADGAPRILLTNRTPARAHEIAGSFPPGITVLQQAGFEAELAHADLLVNTTALGMTGQPGLTLDISHLKPSAIVADIVYAPLETSLLRLAAQRGHRTLDGLGMLLHQAAPGFEKWFGVRPEVTDELRSLVAVDLTSV